ncbi:MAG TPA: hypothetical protein VNE63_10775 [Candidatus Acidoferrales bacterium]|nr:hypothetical protein [Candidatus Acidoferrales bacterium]
MDLPEVVLLLVPLLLAGCQPRQRFTHVGNQNPYIMFDQKTARNCWAGPPSKPPDIASGELGNITPQEAVDFGLESPAAAAKANPASLPFCKDLK